ncbi:hypothetical protein L3X38_042364 [Prunus dulcis]|uniref:Reverse transcriptase domain-containing protein n=1 Tax=Prunus dulcis TaxID=3755 RepID=A0AAD4UUQ6_PRUDU|nr:hypothetical protein L3X38_042364 [Prunus dulcis]
MPSDQSPGEVAIRCSWQKTTGCLHSSFLSLPLHLFILLPCSSSSSCIQSLMEFAYNNSYQASIRMSPFDALYGKQRRTPFYWNEVGENRLEVSEDVEQIKKQVRIIREQLKAAQDRQKNYADVRRKDLQFEVGDWVFLKLSPWKGVVRFGKWGKLSSLHWTISNCGVCGPSSLQACFAFRSFSVA